MLPTQAYAAQGISAPLKPILIERRDPGPNDVLIEILYCGICHSDIHQVRNEWGNSAFPMVPGHEIVGRVTRAGKKVKKFKPGDVAGVGCFVDSCRRCESCRAGEEQFCEKHTAFVYNSTEMDGRTPTYGGYSSQIVVDEKYVLRIISKEPLAHIAPLLCAGITTYSPLKRHNVRRGQRVGIVGLGGLGHMGVKLAASLGARVTVFSTSRAKEKDALRLGAADFVDTKNPGNLAALTNQFDFILDTVSAPHDVNLYLATLRRDRTMVLVGVPEKPAEVQAFSLISGRRILSGSLIGGIRETQEMLDYCARKKLTSDVEVIPITKANEAYDRAVKGDVRYRFVIDMKTLVNGETRNARE